MTLDPGDLRSRPDQRRRRPLCREQGRCIIVHQSNGGQHSCERLSAGEMSRLTIHPRTWLKNKSVQIYKLLLSLAMTWEHASSWKRAPGSTRALYDEFSQNSLTRMHPVPRTHGDACFMAAPSLNSAEKRTKCAIKSRTEACVRAWRRSYPRSWTQKVSVG